MEKSKKKLEVFSVTYICDECGEGEMISSGVALMTNPPQYEHICKNCGVNKTFNVSYPKIEYK